LHNKKIFLNFEVYKIGQVAQLVEQWTENPRVGGKNLGRDMDNFISIFCFFGKEFFEFKKI